MRHIPFHIMSVMIATVTSPVWADETVWISEDGGDFPDPIHWLMGEAPGEADVAVFPWQVNGEVQFAGIQPVTDRVIVRDQVTFVFSDEGSYTLANPSIVTPAIVVAELSGDEADLVIDGGALTGAHMILAADSASTGSLTLGGGAMGHVDLQIDSYVGVGQKGDGAMHVIDGTVSSAVATLGAQLGSSGALLVEGPDSSWTNQNLFIVGKFGDGSLHVRNGAMVETGSVILAQHEEAVGEVIIEGAASMLVIHGSLDIGLYGEGGMIVADGAQVAIEGFVTVGTFPTHTLGPFLEITGFGQGGLTVAGPGSTLSCDGVLYICYFGQGGVTVMDGATLVAEMIDVGESVLDDPGVLSGDGAIHADVIGTGGIVAPGAPLGQLTVNGNVSHLSIQIEVAGVAEGTFDRLVVFGEAELGGSLKIKLVGGFVPQVGDSLEILSAAAVTGEFGAVIANDLPAGLEWQVEYLETAVTITVIGNAGDLNGDGVVGPADLAIVLGNWGPCPAPPDSCIADLNGDGIVGPADLAIVLGNWG